MVEVVELKAEIANLLHQSFVILLAQILIRSLDPLSYHLCQTLHVLKQ